MRRFLVCSGVHGRPKSLQWLRQMTEARQPDGILFAGGVLDTARQYTPRETTPWGMTSEDVRFTEEFLATLGGLGVFSAVIPGRTDTPLEEFLRLGMHAEMEFPGLHLAHATLVTRGDVAVCGMGGALEEHRVSGGETCSRTLAEYHLRPLWTATQPRRILLLPDAPTGPLGGRDGSTLAAELIDSYHPSLCVVGGPSENRGVQRLASTLIINPGQVAEGWAAWLDWDRPAEEQVELLNLRLLTETGVMAEVGVGD